MSRGCPRRVRSRPWRGQLIALGWLLAACGPAVEVIDVSAGPGSGPATDAGQQAAAEPRAGWTRLHAGSHPGTDAPLAGEECSLVLDEARQRILAFGGKTADFARTDELWAFDLRTRGWSRIETEAPGPPPREDHSLIVDTTNDALILFGGKHDAVMRQTWLFDLGAGSWTDITDPSAPVRQRQRAVYDAPRRRMVLFGGMDGNGRLDDETWALDLDRDGQGFGTWSVLDVGPTRPAPRREHGGVLDTLRQRLLVFGGRQRTRTSFRNDLWALDLATDRWTELEPAGNGPPPIRQMVLGFDPASDALTVFGGEILVAREGEEEEYLVNRVWSLDLDDMRWADRSPYPRAMYDHGGVFVPQLGGTVVFGGSTYRTQAEHDTWLLTQP